MNKIVFLSNFLNQHQIEFCDGLYRVLKNNFLFFSTEKINKLEEGSQLHNISRPYLRYLDEPLHTSELYNADVVIFASGPKEILISFVDKNIAVFIYSERLFKKSCLQALHPGNIIEFFRFYKRIDKKNVYFLAAGNYVKHDLRIYNIFTNRIFKWGYYPSYKKYSFNQLVNLKRSNNINILWVGRMISWKRPLMTIEIAVFLIKRGVNNFSFTIIGKGPLLNILKEKIIIYNLHHHIRIIESVEPDQMYKFYTKAHIFVSTSDRQEGWGATINEALAYGCHTFAYYKIGASKFLINNDFYEFKSLNHLMMNLLELITNKNYPKINLVGYKTINSLWNGSKAAIRFISFLNSLSNGKTKDYPNGPLSKV
jgi:hypothetical protein